jgi:hypothetical protein
MVFFVVVGRGHICDNRNQSSPSFWSASSIRADSRTLGPLFSSTRCSSFLLASHILFSSPPSSSAYWWSPPPPDPSSSDPGNLLYSDFLSSIRGGCWSKFWSASSARRLALQERTPSTAAPEMSTTSGSGAKHAGKALTNAEAIPMCARSSRHRSLSPSPSPSKSRSLPPSPSR